MNEGTMPLLPLLKQYFGFTSFRPLQEEIIRDSLAGRDVFALLPTGGGKSLCFQLPSLVRDGLTVVVSPLIALMKDQVDAMQAAGVPATFLNSSLDADESRRRLRALHNGEFRLLYVAPERLMLSGCLDDLQRWNVRLFAIDEAHCISEWGHDFRPEYRQLAELRDLFSGVPFMALTATATDRVRGDIVAHLKLHDPRCYVASFNRPNLNYRVLAKSGAYDQLLDFLRSRPSDSGIVYCSSRKSTERISGNLNEDGVKARPYHAGLTADERTKHQELFLRDDVRVICATIAFGMGINKSNVRFVVHYDLPKNIEGYYQETGRAGRDGLPADCVLLFSPGDVMKQQIFIDEKTDERERQIARDQLLQMVHYAESRDCRRRELLAYFSEEFDQPSCGACDNCLSPKLTFDGTVSAQKFLSCVYRVREKSGFSVGINHIVEVLTGADTEKVRKFGHEQLSTYGIGKEHARTEWAAIGRELIRMGFLSQNAASFNVIELTSAGLDVLKTRATIMLTKPVAPASQKAPRVGDIACDENLFARLRDLRKRLADERGVPAYIVFSDVALRQMARIYPQTENEFARISGVGEKKLQEFGKTFIAEIASYLKTNERQTFEEEIVSAPPAPPPRRSLGDSARETMRQFRAGISAEKIASARDITVGTVLSHITEAVDRGEQIDLARIIPPAEQEQISAAFKKIGFGALVPVFESLGGTTSYDRLRLMRSVLTAQGRIAKA